MSTQKPLVVEKVLELKNQSKSNIQPKVLKMTKQATKNPVYLKIVYIQMNVMKIKMNPNMKPKQIQLVRKSQTVHTL